MVHWHGIRAFVTTDERSWIRISTTPHLKRNIQRQSSPGVRRACIASTLLSQRALVWGGVLEYITYYGASITSLNFWLSWFLKILKKKKKNTLYSCSYSYAIWVWHYRTVLVSNQGMNVVKDWHTMEWVPILLTISSNVCIKGMPLQQRMSVTGLGLAMSNSW